AATTGGTSPRPRLPEQIQYSGCGERCRERLDWRCFRVDRATKGVGSRTPLFVDYFLSATRVAETLSLVGHPEAHLAKEPRAVAPGVVVDSDLKIESQRVSAGAGRLPVGYSVGVGH